MEKRRLGNSDLYVSVVGMGCWQYGGGKYWGEQSQADVNYVVNRALDRGVNYFDTAEMYNDGKSEEALGEALKLRRNEAIIGTKVTPANVYPDDLQKSCEESLKRLQTDYIDLYMVHWPINPLSVKHFTNDKGKICNPPDLAEAIDTLTELKKAGKIRHIGISNHGIKQMTELHKLGVDVITNELPYNLLSRAIENELTLHCRNNNIGIIGYMPLQQGLLTGKYALEDVKPMQARSRHFHHSRGEQSRHGEEGTEREIKEALQTIKQLSNEYGVDLITLSLSWVLANSDITTTIVGSRNETQLEQNLQGALYDMPSELYEELNKVTKPILDRLGSNPDYYENRKNSRIY
ncbi:aldo/keto reductase [Desertibacillus haloalkaliphilus]|uniref:aldo/keto reductase n=1 Tax=Desertibacillus haloalkaliphilus TaxID=1328930 RepID=UPI001C275862|nr:aldo/keto reductase [Desertibacillus haloalkaliphilus]MBU8907679.1 aldo/keto reductase [Desertibacillus haloalkaliphilus]